MKKIIYLSSIIALLFISMQSFTANSNSNTIKTDKIYYNSCRAADNLDEICDNFISRCRKGSIKSEFPSQFLKVKIKVVKKGKSKAHKKAWKLLSDNRFKK